MSQNNGMPKKNGTAMNLYNRAVVHPYSRTPKQRHPMSRVNGTSMTKTGQQPNTSYNYPANPLMTENNYICTPIPYELPGSASPQAFSFPGSKDTRNMSRNATPRTEPQRNDMPMPMENIPDWQARMRVPSPSSMPITKAPQFPTKSPQPQGNYGASATQGNTLASRRTEMPRNDTSRPGFVRDIPTPAVTSDIQRACGIKDIPRPYKA